MARYIGPKIKISRRFGQKLGLRTNEEAFTRRPYKPGEHGAKSRRGRVSEYSRQLTEKQKTKYLYGILERQFHRYYLRASKSDNVGLTFLQLLETRLDTVVFRAGFTHTQNQARQLVNHGHVLVDGKKVSIPSYSVKTGQKISITPAMQKSLAEQAGSNLNEVPTWLNVNKNFSVEVLALPVRDQISTLIDEQMIIEYYSR